jgi:hypothetical protein
MADPAEGRSDCPPNFRRASLPISGDFKGFCQMPEGNPPNGVRHPISLRNYLFRYLPRSHTINADLP